MSDPRLCRHPDYVPVEVALPDLPGLAPVIVVVAHLCLGCDEQLPANWGCEVCEWEDLELRRLCEVLPEVVRVLSRPCPTHEGD